MVVVVVVVVDVVVVISTFSVVLLALALLHLLEHLLEHLDLLHGLTGLVVTMTTGGLLTISGASVTTGCGRRTVLREHFDRTAAPHLDFSCLSPPTSGLSAAAGVGLAGVGDGLLTWHGDCPLPPQVFLCKQGLLTSPLCVFPQLLRPILLVM